MSPNLHSLRIKFSLVRDQPCKKNKHIAHSFPNIQYQKNKCHFYTMLSRIRNQREEKTRMSKQKFEAIKKLASEGVFEAAGAGLASADAFSFEQTYLQRLGRTTL